MIYPRVREHMSFDELVALGNEGLVEAASRYDAAKGASFNTFAWYRVQGAIIDGIRRNTNLPRRVWAKLVALRAASEYLEHSSEREAGAVIKGIQLPTGPDALAKIREQMSAIRTMYVTSLEALQEKGFDPSGDPPAHDDSIDLQRMRAKLRKALDQLPTRERELLKRHYWEGKNLLEAGAELGISKSWASRLHAQAVDRLKKYVEDG